MSVPLHRSPRPCTHRPKLLVASIGLIALLLTACSPTISTFNARAYDQATSLKVETLALMDHATEPYEDHSESIERLNIDLRKAHEFAKGRPNNEISARQWRILISPERELVGGFLRDWQNESTLSAAFVAEKKEQIAAAFDTIIELESGKIKPDEVRSGS